MINKKGGPYKSTVYKRCTAAISGPGPDPDPGPEIFQLSGRPRYSVPDNFSRYKIQQVNVL